MSQLVTTRPDTLIAVLESQGARCGDGIEPRILEDCPVESFCWLDGEEICVLGPTHDACTASAASLTPPSTLAAALETVESARELTMPSTAAGSSELSVLAIVLLVAAGIGLAARRRDHHVFSDHGAGHTARHS